MKRLSLLSIPTCLGFVFVSMLPALQADPVKHMTEVTFSGPTEIPGMVLSPGTYVMKVPDPYTHKDVVGFYNPNESHLYKLVRTVPAYRNNLTDKTVITFEERANGAPEAVHQWFYPDTHWGYEFVYSKVEALPQVAEATAPPPPAVTPAPQPAPEVAPQPAPEPIAQTPPPPPPAPVEEAQAAPPPPEPAPAATPAPPQELPKTASNYPLVLSAGILLLAAGAFLRVKA